ncbi:hypothetical protein C8J56DRAFT_1170538 [Mycena floridula]|nr:hypothetical protein C8J56DRAFT_1170538 [Mycena floridula]
MTPRPALRAKQQNRNSAVYIGSDSSSTPPALPDLPEPPSPGGSLGSNRSGLPSPPATNSTGSGSTGDPASIAFRKRPFSVDNRHNMLTDSNVKAFHSAFDQSHHLDDDDDDNHDDNENDEDNTARLDRISLKSSSENVQALQRVKSLTERNRMALDKLSSYSRLSTPSPNLRPSKTRSPISQTVSLASTSSARHRTSISSMSGSETERESVHLDPMTANSQSSSSGSSSIFANRPTTPLSYGSGSTRLRLKSAPTSPAKIRLGLSDSSSSNNSNSPSRARKRVSIVMADLHDAHPRSASRSPEFYSEPKDVTQLALAAVASSRRSPTGGSGKKRQPLPREFRDNSSGASSSRRGSVDSPPTRYSLELPERNSTLPLSPRGSQARTLGRSSTVRELTRKHQTRWVSEDLSANLNDDDEDLPPRGSRVDTGRRQSLRGGSAESALTVGPGRSLVGEGLRAAGLSRRSTLDSYEPDLSPERSQSRLGRATGSEGPRARNGTITTPRAATSMADYRNPTGDEPRTAPALRTYKSAYPLPQGENRRESMDRAPSSMSRYDSPGPQDRYSSPMPSRRFGTVGSSGAQQQQQQQPEHARLMEDSLAMFESQLRRLPHLDSSSELMKNAQAIVYGAEKLNALLKHGTNRALEEQIDAEVSDSPVDADLVEIWRKVGGEYREGLRASDELVRSITGLLLGVGRAVREIAGIEGHGRSMSLDEENLGRASRTSMSPDVTGSTNGGRRSAESRKSWEPGRPGRPESALAARPPSSMRNPEPQTVGRNSTPSGFNSSSVRRLYTPRDQRDSITSRPGAIATVDSQETVHGYEPSPTPATRKPRVSESRSLAPLNIPKPLPTLPSESHRRPTTSSNEKGSQRRRPSVSTIRAPAFPSLTPNSATTALTPHTVSNSPDRLAFPLLRNDSQKANGKATVTFSRSSTVSAITGLQQQHLADQRKRTISNVEPEPMEHRPVVPRQLSASETERERERETNRRTLDRPRMSLDGARESTGRAADRSAAASILGPRRERRRTVVDIWPPPAGQ